MFPLYQTFFQSWKLQIEIFRNVRISLKHLQSFQSGIAVRWKSLINYCILIALAGTHKTKDVSSGERANWIFSS